MSGARDGSRRSLALAALLTLAVGTLPGCALLRVGDLEERVGKLEKTRDAFRAELETERKRLLRVREEADEATSYLREHGARISSRLDDIEQKLVRIRGEFDELVHASEGNRANVAQQRAAIESIDRRLRELIGDLRDRAGIAILALPRELPEHADDWVKLAQTRFDEGEVRVADAVARECRKRFPGTTQAGRCGLILGKIAYEEHRFGDATTSYQAVHDELSGKGTPEVGDALLGIADVMEAQGKCKEARQVLEYLRNLMKKGDAWNAAKERLDSQKARCTDGKVVLPPKTSGSKPATALPAAAPTPQGTATPAAAPTAAAPAAKAAADKTAADKAAADKAAADKATADKAKPNAP